MNKLLISIVLILAPHAFANPDVAEPSGAPAPDRTGCQAGTRLVPLSNLSQLPKAGSTEAKPAASYYIQNFRNAYGGQCLDGDRNQIPANGARVQLWQCNGWDNQRWIFTPAPNYPVGWYVIQNAHGGQCLDGDRNQIPANGATVQLWQCNGWNNQVWEWTGAVFHNAYGGQCLDGDRNQIPANGARVQLWQCNGWDNQRWLLN